MLGFELVVEAFVEVANVAAVVVMVMAVAFTSCFEEPMVLIIRSLGCTYQFLVVVA